MPDNDFAIDPLAPSYDRRRGRRIGVNLKVQVETEHLRQSGRMEELPRTGAKLEVAATSAPNEIMTLHRAGLKLRARVIWSRNRLVGIEFNHPLSEDAFLRMRRARD